MAVIGKPDVQLFRNTLNGEIALRGLLKGVALVPWPFRRSGVALVSLCRRPPAYEPVEMMKASHMNPEEAVQAALDLGARRTLAVQVPER